MDYIIVNFIRIILLVKKQFNVYLNKERLIENEITMLLKMDLVFMHNNHKSKSKF